MDHSNLLLPALLALSCAAGAGTVEVSYVNPANYTDAGSSSIDERANVEELGRYLQKLGERLPAGYVLKVDLLDVDLAGSVRATRPGSVRTVRGGADFPRVQLRYTLQAPGQAPRGGEEAISDINYTFGVASVRSEPLYYEKRMLERWFTQRFGDVSAQR